jgi:hypothetical protein
MTDSETEDDGWEQGSRDEEQSEDGSDDVEEMEDSGSRVSGKPILWFPERNEEDKFWTRSDETKTVSVKNKFKFEDMTRVRQHKELLWTEVAKNDPTSLVDRWLWDHIKVDRWDRITGVFPQGDKCSPKHKWVLMTTLWICCAHYNCMTVYDVTNSNDTQRNLHLTDHHFLVVKTLHGNKVLHTVRQGTLAERNDDVLNRNMTITRLAHRDNRRILFGNYEQVKLALRSVLKRTVIPLVHLNADLWTSKVSHQKFLGVHIFWKTGPDLKTTLIVVTLYAPPKVEDKQESEWLFEYVLVVLKWYAVEPRHVKGSTSDAGSDFKKSFNKLKQELGWM